MATERSATQALEDSLAIRIDGSASNLKQSDRETLKQILSPPYTARWPAATIEECCQSFYSQESLSSDRASKPIKSNRRITASIFPNHG